MIQNNGLTPSTSSWVQKGKQGVMQDLNGGCQARPAQRSEFVSTP